MMTNMDDLSDEGMAVRRLMRLDYGVSIGDRVIVELLVAAGAGPVIIDGTVRGGSPAVLLIEELGRTARIPWTAIAGIYDPIPTPPPHPADQT